MAVSQCRSIVPSIVLSLVLGCGAASGPQGAALPAAAAGHADARIAAPVLFAPGVVTGPPTFSPDGKTVYFARKRGIMVSHARGDTWTEPEVVSFSGHWGDGDPAMSPDGSFLIFASNRPPVEPGPVLDGEWGAPTRTSHPGLGANLWRVERQGDGWGQPTRLPDTVNRGTAVMEPCVVADGSLYFMDAHLPGRFRFYRSQLEGGVYQEPVQLPFSDGTWSDWDETVPPDESFMVFASDRPPVTADHGDDLFIAFRDRTVWREVTHLAAVNDPKTGSIKPRLGSDHHTLYFLSDRETGVAGVAPALSNVWRVDLAPLLHR
jgi:hypothetical protein